MSSAAGGVQAPQILDGLYIGDRYHHLELKPTCPCECTRDLRELLAYLWPLLAHELISRQRRWRVLLALFRAFRLELFQEAMWDHVVECV